MKKIILIAMLIIPFLGFTQAESAIKIKGTITVSETQEPLPFVILLLEINGVVVSRAQSDFDGYYVLEIPRFGTYDLRIIDFDLRSELHQNMLFDKSILYDDLRLNFELKSETVHMEGPTCHEHCDCLQESYKKMSSELAGKIIDSETGEPMPFVNIVVYQGDIQINGGQSDFDGNYKIKPLKPGTYTIKTSSVGYMPVELSGVTIDSNSTAFVDLKMKPSFIVLEDIIIRNYRCGCCCLICYPDTVNIEPIIDLFAEQDSINDTITAVLPSTLFSKKSQVSALSVFPNPTSGEITIANISGLSEITLMDINGKIMKMIDETDMMQQSIDLSFYKPGVYFLRYMEDGEPKAHRILKL